MHSQKFNLLKAFTRVVLAIIVLQWPLGLSLAHPGVSASSDSVDWDNRVDKLLQVSDDNDIIFTAVGDMIYNREITHFNEPYHKNLYRIIQDARLGYGNLEMSLNEQPGKQRGTFNFRQGREFAWEIAKLGVNLVSLANNHSLDYGKEGLTDCLRILRQSGFRFAGGGPNLTRARSASFKRILKTNFALLSYYSTRRSSRANPNEPTIATIGAVPVYIQKEDGSIEAVPAAVEADVTAMEDAISVAKRHADIVVVAFHLHWVPHQRPFPLPDKVPPHQTLLIHKAMDAGADIIIGTGPHVLRGIEIYKGKPIFYSIGNFIYQWKTPEIPNIIWERDEETFSGVVGSDPSLRGVDVREESETVVIRFTVRDKKINKIELVPVTLEIEGPRMGSPRLANDKRGKEIIDLIQKLSDPYKTKIIYKDWYGEVMLENN